MQQIKKENSGSVYNLLTTALPTGKKNDK